MAEEQKNIKVEVIPVTAVINIEVSGGLYGRLQQLILRKASEKTIEEYQKTLEYLRTGKPRDEYEYTLETLLSLVYEIEVAAKAQNKLAYVDPSELKFT